MILKPPPPTRSSPGAQQCASRPRRGSPQVTALRPPAMAPPLASTSGTSGSQIGFRVKKMVSRSSTRKNSLLLSLHLHPSSSLDAHSRPLTPRDLGHPGTNFSANFATGAEGWFWLSSRICETLRSGESTEGLSLPVPLRESARRGRESCTGWGTSSRVCGVLSPDLGLMGTN